VDELDEFARPGETSGVLQAARHALAAGLTGPCSPATGETLHYRLTMVAKAAMGIARHTTTEKALAALRAGVLDVAVRAAEVLAERDPEWRGRACAAHAAAAGTFATREGRAPSGDNPADWAAVVAEAADSGVKIMVDVPWGEESGGGSRLVAFCSPSMVEGAILCEGRIREACRMEEIGNAL
jgi:hypothetical protein